MDKYWNDFSNSGKINDYLNYKKNEQKAEIKNENKHQGFGNTGAVNRGE